MHAPTPEPTVTGLRTTHTSSVTEDQIDHLGHMNVRFYAVNAMAGTAAMLADLPGWAGRRHVVHDLYTRHHREQLLGSPLVVRSAFLGAGPDGVRLHHELANADTGVLAATFVHGVSPLGDTSEDRLPVPDAAIDAARAAAIELPAYAATRTIALDHDPLAEAPSLATLQARGLASRKERRVSAEECDKSGAYRIEQTPLLTWGGEMLDGEPPGDTLHETRDGKRMGWASMETRMRFDQLPRRGTRIQAFMACVAIHDKVTHDLHWCFDLDTGRLLTAFETVSMAFDIVGRTPMSIPDGYRRKWERLVQPDLTPTRANPTA
jgi:acyl-CoA thioesterase FadM